VKNTSSSFAGPLSSQPLGANKDENVILNGQSPTDYTNREN
jgi:hypothetical protein